MKLLHMVVAKREKKVFLLELLFIVPAVYLPVAPTFPYPTRHAGISF